MEKVLVIGAGGKTGRHVVAGLVSKGAKVYAGSRKPEGLRLSGAEAVRFDWDDESTWGPALSGVNSVYLVKPHSPEVVEIVSKFVGRMKVAGARRIVLLSECATQTRADDITERHVERVVEEGGLEWTILRPSWYMEDIVDDEFFGPMVRNDRIIVMTTGGAATAWIDPRDIADVAVEVLLNGGRSGQALDLTGPEALTLQQLAARISAAAGHTVQAIEESVSDAEARMRAAGMDEDFIAYITRIGESIIAGDTATVTGEVKRATGIAPRTIDAYLKENASRLLPAGQAAADLNPEQMLQRSLENEALFRRLITAWASSDFDGLTDCFAEDLVYTDMPFPDAQVRGKTAFREHVKGFNSLFANGQVEVEFVTVVANSSTVIGELKCKAQLVGAGAPTGGVPVTWHVTLADTVVDGKVVNERVYFDPTAFETAARKAST